VRARAATIKRRGFTLLELVLAMTVVAVVSVVVTPVLLASADAYAAARDLRRTADEAAFATSLVTRTIREAPPGDSTRIGVVSADADSLIFTNDTGVRLTGGTLEAVTPQGPVPVARGVSALAFVYVSDDGVTPCPPAEAHRVHVSLTVRGLTVSAVAFPRVNVGVSE
jgi:prepilin-type N-terminal cleavage/methylation domain-containing protein